MSENNKVMKDSNQGLVNAEEEKMSPYSWKVLLFVFVAWVFDAADGTIYSLTLPMIREELNLSLAQMGLIGSIFLAGAVLGSIILPYLSDRKGRRWGMASCIGLYSVFSGFTGLAQNFNQLAVSRFFTGWGTGGEWPIGAAYLSEVVPAKKRGFAMGLMQAGYPIGYFIAAGIFALFASWDLLWRNAYFVLLIPAVLCFFVLKTLKESDRWLKNKENVQNMTEKKISYKELFKPQYIKNTIIGSLLHICAGFYGWGLVIWFPSILLMDFNIDKMTTSYITMFMWAVATIAYIIAGSMSDKIGRKPTLAVFCTIFLASICLLNYFKTLPDVPLVMLYGISTLIGCGHGYNTILIGYTSEIFPSHVRTIGTGFVVAIGKLAGLVAPLVLGIIAQSYSISIGLLFGAIIGWMMVPLIYLRKETAQKRLEDIVE